MTDANAKAPPASKVASKDASKDATKGYHYWHEQANQGTAPRAQPVKLTEEEAALARKLEGSGGSGLSSWNKAGTWEERSHTDWARARAEALLVGKRFPVGAAAHAAITAVKTFKGDATVVMVRGKPRPGFDFNVALTWEATGWTTEEGEGEEAKGPAVKGSVKIPEASKDTVEDDEVDFEVVVEDRKAERRSQEDAARDTLRKALKPFLREAFKTIDDELTLRAEGKA